MTGIRCAVSLLLVIVTAQAQANDVIHLTQGRQLRGTISNMTAKMITIDTSGGKREIEIHKIRMVTYNGEPRSLSRARRNVLEGRYNSAMDDLARIDSPPSAKLMQLDVSFYKTLCTAKLALEGGSGSLSDAAAAVQTLVNDPAMQDNYHYYELVEVYGDLAMAAGRFAPAEREYRKLQALNWPEYVLRANYRVACALQGQDKFQNAIDLFKKVEADSLDSEEARAFKTSSKVRGAACLAGLGRPEEGIKLLEAMIGQENDSNTRLFGEIYNALGACYVKSGRTKDALLSYLHVDLLFYQDRAAHAEALYHLNTLWKQVNKPDRAREASDKLKNFYGSTVWATKI